MTTNVQDPTWKEQTPQNYVGDDAMSAEAVRSDIDATRSRLSSHLDQIQERLQPENIKQQAQDAIQTAVTDSVDSVKEYVESYAQNVNWNEVRDGVLGTVRRNPVPAALVGIGLGWMLLGGNRDQSQPNPNRYGNPYPQPDQYGQDKRGWREASAPLQSYGNRAPRPAGNQVNRPYAPQGNQVRSSVAGYSMDETERTMSRQSDAGSMTDQIKETVGDVGSQVSDGARQLKDSIGNQAAAVSDQVQETAQQIGERAGEWAEQWQQSGESAAEWGQQTLEEFSGYAQRSLNENPLLFGAVSLAVGAGLAMLLPATGYEDQLMGDLRNQTVEKAQGMVDEVKDRAQTVIDELQPEFEKVASNVIESIQETGKQALGEVQETGKQALGEVRQSLQSATDKLDETIDSKVQADQKALKPVPTNR